MKDELADLAAELRAWMEAEQGRGASAVADGPLPPAVPIKAEPQVPAPEPDARWSALAHKARNRPRSPAEQLEVVRQDLGDCQRCPLCTGRRHLVFGSGAATARLMIIGEGPGQREDATGEPFVGPAGAMLDKMLQHVVGVAREEVYITNVVKCRPPNNRNPEPTEIARCRPFLDAQIEAIGPDLILVLGSVALKALTENPRASIMRSRGRWMEVAGIKTMPTLHPAYLLRKPEDKRLTFSDLKLLAAANAKLQ